VAFNGTTFVVTWQSANQDGSGAGIYEKLYSSPTALNLSGVDQTTTFVYKSAPVALIPNAVISASASDTITGATVSISNWLPEDRLAFSNTSGLLTNFTTNPGTQTAMLTVTGNATAAVYQAFLRSITYQDVSTTPNTTLIRVATIAVSDASKTATGTEKIQVIGILSGLSPTVTYVHGQPPISVMPALLITIPSTQLIGGANVIFTNWQPEDRLAFSNVSALQHTFVVNSAMNTATLSLVGHASAAAYQADLRSITYQDVAGNPNTSVVRNATITIFANTYTASATTAVNVANVLQGLGQTVDFVSGSAPLDFAQNLVISLPAGVDATSAQITFTNWQAAEDRLAIGSVAGLKNSLSVDAATNRATLSASGVGSAAAYQQLLNSLTYQDISTTPNTSVTRLGNLTLNFGSMTATTTQNIVVLM
jgi:hypothetical protein